ncbi:MAG: phage holin family protein [Porphyrobacter sp.]|nr:phage holin family protein [Porphyrobacter sp.]
MSDIEEIAHADSTGVDESAENRSLIDDVEVLIDDGKTYLEAELNYQKTRALFAGDRAKGVALYGLVGLIFAWMALIGLTVGLIFALTPPLGAWGATAVVVVVWLVIAGVALRAAAGRWRELVSSFDEGSDKT